MSWISDALSKAGPIGRTLNSVGGTALNAIDPILQEIPVVGTIDRAGHALGNLIPGGPNSLPSLGTVGTKGTPGAQGPSSLDQLLGLYGAGNAAYLQDKANNFANLAGESVDRAYNEKAPLRAQGIAGVQAAPVTLPSLGKIRMNGNPFAQG